MGCSVLQCKYVGPTLCASVVVLSFRCYCAPERRADLRRIVAAAGGEEGWLTARLSHYVCADTQTQTSTVAVSLSVASCRSSSFS